MVPRSQHRRDERRGDLRPSVVHADGEHTRERPRVGVAKGRGAGGHPFDERRELVDTKRHPLRGEGSHVRERREALEGRRDAVPAHVGAGDCHERVEEPGGRNAAGGDRERVVDVFDNALHEVAGEPPCLEPAAAESVVPDDEVGIVEGRGVWAARLALGTVGLDVGDMGPKLGCEGLRRGWVACCRREARDE